MSKCSLIKSCTRVRDLGEVFTPRHIVRDMCNLIPKDVWENIDATFLEPACGNGNFIIEILNRKLKRCKDINDCVRALQSIYGVDIMPDNVEECRCRMLGIVLAEIQKKECVCWRNIKNIVEILETNIICGNTLTMLDSNGDDLKFKDWKTGQFETLKQMLNAEPVQTELQL